MEPSTPYTDLVDASLREDPEYAAHLVASAWQCLIDREPEVARVLLNDVCRGKVGYAAAADGLDLGADELRLALAEGPASVELLVAILQRLQELTGGRVTVSVAA